jgi:hypothetical protein
MINLKRAIEDMLRVRCYFVGVGEGLSLAMSEGGTALTSAAGGTTAGTAIGETAASAGGGSATAASALDTVSTATSTLSEALSPITSIFNASQTLQQQEENKRRFDLQFAENMRRYGMDFALKEWQIRKNMTLAEAMDAFNKKTTMATLKETLQASAQQRRFGEQQQRWLAEDRAKKEKMEKTFTKALFHGMVGKD